MDIETLRWAEIQARMYQVLTNPRRVLILRALAGQEMSVGEIAAKVGATMQNTSQHLRIMKDRGLLHSRRDGQTIYYFIADSELLSKLGLSGCEDNL